MSGLRAGGGASSRIFFEAEGTRKLEDAFEVEVRAVNRPAARQGQRQAVRQSGTFTLPFGMMSVSCYVGCSIISASIVRNDDAQNRFLNLPQAHGQR
jgi:hypothetical protein